MTKTFCDKCGRELDYWGYRKYHSTWNADVVWNKPHQSDPDGFQTFLGYISPGDVHMNLCQECGSKFLDLVKDWAKNDDNKDDNDDDKVCKYYSVKTERKRLYDTVSGNIRGYYNEEVGVCLGTKENDICKCKGNEDECNLEE